jgi:hypothetical protein
VQAAKALGISRRALYLHHGQHLTFKEAGKTRSVYVPKDLLPEVRTWLGEHKRLKTLLHEIHLLTVALLKARADLSKRTHAPCTSRLDPDRFPPRFWKSPGN